ncbi:MAG: prolyl oligopeptidase family serine peptidase [Acidobacteriota bacterium]|nr:prolyl oligopeptidase family serine peptidase [Acidobacteriota bacterium]
MLSSPTPGTARILLVVLVWTLTSEIALGTDLRVLPASARPDGEVRLLRDHLRPLVHAALDRRLQAYEALKTPEQIRDYQERLRAEFIESLGGFPERTPLRPRVVGRLTGDGFRAEKLIYESRPGFHVTAVLYLPEAEPPYPGVLVPCGHSENGKAAELYQRAAILMARNGLAVLCYDPVGQGERKQILEDGAPRSEPAKGRFRPTEEHNLAGVAPILLGRNLATYRIWDGIRSIDYLAGRDDVDESRIGCTGNSGGGLMTAYLMALDPRIAAAASSCFITTTRRKNDDPGPGDAEQNIYAQTAYGMDHADYILMRAPKPALILAATKDFVPIAGAWETYRQAKRLYTRLGVAERVGLVEADEKHGFSLHLRTGACRWMRRWLLDRVDEVNEPDFDVFSDRQLQCTPQGQVLLLEGARSVFQLYRAEEERLRRHRERSWQPKTDQERRTQVRETAGIRPLSEIPPPAVQAYGTVRRTGYRIEKLILQSAGGFPLPALRFVPEHSRGEWTLYLNGRGKQIDAGPGGPIESLARGGHPVLAVDLTGLGETESTAWRYDPKYIGNNSAEYFIAYMLGRSLVGMRAEDILACARYLRVAAEEAKRVNLVAVGRAGIAALHAAAVEPELFGRVGIRDSIDSWRRVVETDVTVDQLENTVHGALRWYDLGDLARLAGKDRVVFDRIRTASGALLESVGERGGPGD